MGNVIYHEEVEDDVEKTYVEGNSLEEEGLEMEDCLLDSNYEWENTNI